MKEERRSDPLSVEITYEDGSVKRFDEFLAVGFEGTDEQPTRWLVNSRLRFDDRRKLVSFAKAVDGFMHELQSEIQKGQAPFGFSMN